MQLFLNVDANGEIIDSYYGENVIASESFDFFFLVDEAMVNNLPLYHVVMDGFKARLILKEVV